MNIELIKTLENRGKKNIMLMIEEWSRPLVQEAHGNY
jgi:hypothetical protein